MQSTEGNTIKFPFIFSFFNRIFENVINNWNPVWSKINCPIRHTVRFRERLIDYSTPAFNSWHLQLDANEYPWIRKRSLETSREINYYTFWFIIKSLGYKLSREWSACSGAPWVRKFVNLWIQEILGPRKSSVRTYWCFLAIFLADAA